MMEMIYLTIACVCFIGVMISLRIMIKRLHSTCSKPEPESPKFELFTKGLMSATVTIHTSGQITFDSVTVAEHMASTPFCKLYYDKGERLIGFEPDVNRDTNNVPVDVQLKDIRIHARLFLDYCRIDYSETHIYEVKETHDNNVLFYIDLNKPKKWTDNFQLASPLMSKQSR